MSSYYGVVYVSEDVTNNFFLTPFDGIKGKEAMKSYVTWITSMRNVTLAIRDSKPHKIRYISSKGGLLQKSRTKETQKRKEIRVNFI